MSFYVDKETGLFLHGLWPSTSKKDEHTKKNLQITFESCILNIFKQNVSDKNIEYDVEMKTESFKIKKPEKNEKIKFFQSESEYERIKRVKKIKKTKNFKIKEKKTKNTEKMKI